jgi:hypothetical protein
MIDSRSLATVDRPLAAFALYWQTFGCAAFHVHNRMVERHVMRIWDVDL